MSKIVQAANAMISSQKKITEVTRSRIGDEIFFLFDNKYVWSIVESEGDYVLWFYPKGDLINLASYEHYDWDSVAMIRYSTKDLGTKEAFATFAELYNVVNENMYGVNDVLDDIIEHDIPF